MSLQKNKKKDKAPAATTLVVNDIRLLSVDRTMKDVGRLRSALRNAEAIYFPNRSQYYDLLSDVELDAFLTGIIGKRIDAVLNKELQFVCNDKEVEEMETFLESSVFRDMRKEILKSIFQGLSGMEFVPGDCVEFEEIPRKHIQPEKGIIVLDQSAYEGVEYKDVQNIWVIGKKRDFGLLLQCAFYALIKKGDFGDWAQYVEIFGQPIRTYEYDANDEKTKLELRKVIDEAGGSLAIMYPSQSKFNIMDGKSSNGDGKLQESLKNACNDEMSIVILGNTETTSSTNGGSNAKAQEHGKQQMEVTKSDMAFLLSHLNSPKCIAILKSYGLPVEGGRFKFEKQIDLTALTQKINIDIQVAGKVPVADDYFYDTYGIPKPDNYDEMKAQQVADKQAQQQPPAPDPANTPPGKPKPDKPAKKPDNPTEKPKLSLWHEFRASAANFFGHAR